MAILCLANGLHDLKERLSKIIVAYDYSGNPITAGMLKAQGAMAALLKDAVKPNLVQTLENVPAIIHGGPFANIAHGCNSVMATKTALKLADYTITLPITPLQKQVSAQIWARKNSLTLNAVMPV